LLDREGRERLKDVVDVEEVKMVEVDDSFNFVKISSETKKILVKK